MAAPQLICRSNIFIALMIFLVCIMSGCVSKPEQADLTNKMSKVFGDNLPLKLDPILLDSLIEYANRFPGNDIFAVCVMRTSNNETRLMIESLPNRQSSLFSTPTPFFVWNPQHQKLFLFYSGLEILLSRADWTVHFQPILESLTLYDDWDEDNNQQLHYSVYCQNARFDVVIQGDSIRLLQKNLGMLDCILPQRLQQKFSIPPE
ncbi:MAG: hypothetical protein SF053_21425 [Bacteroidia bacterium]|nr:hypothetical protein [Bacteroidia bacterium]